MMEDIGDILEIERKKDDKPKAPTIKSRAIRRRKSTSTAKERLLQELDVGLPPIIPTQDFNPFRKKRETGTGGSKWVQAQFSPNSRKDLTLTHWIPEIQKNQPYPFNRCITSLDVPSVSAEDYVNLGLDKEQGWTYQETKELLDLSKQFDLRFSIIADRCSGTRTIEDVKGQYYAVLEALFKAGRGPPPITYNKAHEQKRKQQLDGLLSKTRAQVDNEEALLQALKTLEAERKKHAKDQDHVEKLLRVCAVTKGVSANPLYIHHLKDEHRHARKAKSYRLVEVSPDSENPLAEKARLVTASSADNPYCSKTAPTHSQAHTSANTRIENILQEMDVRAVTYGNPLVADSIRELRQDLALLIDLDRHVARRLYEVSMGRQPDVPSITSKTRQSQRAQALLRREKREREQLKREKEESESKKRKDAPSSSAATTTAAAATASSSSGAKEKKDKDKEKEKEKAAKTGGKEKEPPSGKGAKSTKKRPRPPSTEKTGRSVVADTSKIVIKKDALSQPAAPSTPLSPLNGFFAGKTGKHS